MNKTSPPWFDLTHLRYFQTIVACGSLTAAAKKLKVSQPTLTVALRHLEQRLGTTLLLRDRSGVSLTATGQELHRYAADVCALIERAEQDIRGLQQDPVGNFIIGCHESLGAYFLPGFMAEFLPHAPGIELSLWNGTSAAVQEAVLARKVHFGLAVNPLPHPELVIVELFHDAMDLLVLGSRMPPSLVAAHEMLRKGPLIYAGRVNQCQQLLDRLASLQLLPTRLLSCGDLELVKSLALSGIGVAMLPRRVAHYGHPRKLLRLHFDLPYIPDTICLLYRADMHRTRGALFLKEALSEFGKELDRSGDGT